MTRSRFLSLAGALLAAPLLGRLAASPPRSDPKIGHLAIGMPHCRPGDWKPLLDGKPVPKTHYVVALDDTEGWYDHYTAFLQDRDGHGYAAECVNGEFVVRRVHGNVSVRYLGTDPRFAAFKDHSLDPFTLQPKSTS